MAVGHQVHIDAPLSGLAVTAFSDGTGEFIGDMLLPSIPVAKSSDLYYTISKNAFLRNPNALRAPKTIARTVEFDVSTATYLTKNYALAGEMSIEDLSNADTAIQYRNNTTRLVTANLRRAQEIRIANLITSLSNVGSSVILAGTDKWSNFINSNPLADVTTAHAFIRSRTGLEANTLAIDYDTFQVVRRHPQLLDLYKYTNGGQLAEAQLADTFRVSKMLIGKGVVENALEGGTSSMTNIWGNNAILSYIGPSTGMQTTTFGLRFTWQPDGAPGPFVVERRLDVGARTRKVEVIEVGHYQDERIIASDLIYVINTTL